MKSEVHNIPVGCVPSAAVAVCSGGGGVCLGGFVCPGGASAHGGYLPGGGCVCPGRKVMFSQASVILFTGVCVPGGMSGRHPPVNRITDACENITLPQLRCGQ